MEYLYIIPTIGFLSVILVPLFKYGFNTNGLLKVNIPLMWVFVILIWVCNIINYLIQ